MHFKYFCKSQLLGLVALATIFSSPLSAAETVITSDRLEKRTEGSEDHFFFYDNVRIVATNLVATCDAMEVVTEGTPDEKESIPKFGAIEAIIARGNVHIEQPLLERTAKADKAEILPQKGEVILTGNAEVTDKQGTVKGHRMRLVKGEERAIVEGSAEGGRPKVVLPSMPDFDLGKLKKGNADDVPAEQTAEMPQGLEPSQGSIKETQAAPEPEQAKEAL